MSVGRRRCRVASGWGAPSTWCSAGRWLDAGEAEALGLVVGVVARRRLEAASLALARRLARIPPAAALAARRCVRAAHDLPLEAGVALERRLALALERAAP